MAFAMAGLFQEVTHVNTLRKKSAKKKSPVHILLMSWQNGCRILSIIPRLVTILHPKRCYPHTGNGKRSWCLSRNPPLSVEIFNNDEAIHSLLNWKQIIEHGAYDTRGRPAHTTFLTPQRAAHPCVLYQVCEARGAGC